MADAGEFLVDLNVIKFDVLVTGGSNAASVGGDNPT